jgi:hypothetical protein
MTNPDIAKHVYINMAKGDEHRFTVDGEEFPWYITERGPIVTQVSDNLYTIHVEIFLIDKNNPASGYNWDLSFTASGYAGRTPHIGDREFPWAITEDGFTFSTSCRDFPKLSLAFYASEVEVFKNCVHIHDARDKYDINGNLWHTAEGKQSESSASAAQR